MLLGDYCNNCDAFTEQKIRLISEISYIKNDPFKFTLIDCCKRQLNIEHLECLHKIDENSAEIMPVMCLECSMLVSNSFAHVMMFERKQRPLFSSPDLSFMESQVNKALLDRVFGDTVPLTKHDYQKQLISPCSNCGVPELNQNMVGLHDQIFDDGPTVYSFLKEVRCLPEQDWNTGESNPRFCQACVFYLEVSKKKKIEFLQKQNPQTFLAQVMNEPKKKVVKKIKKTRPYAKKRRLHNYR